MYSSSNKIKHFDDLINVLNGLTHINTDEFNFSNMCCTCLGETESSNNLYFDIEINDSSSEILKPDKFKLSYILSETTGISLDTLNGYPKQICNHCIEKLCSSYVFKVQSKKVEATLAKLYQLLITEKNQSEILENVYADLESFPNSIENCVVENFIIENLETDKVNEHELNYSHKELFSEDKNTISTGTSNKLKVPTIKKLFNCSICIFEFKSRKLFEHHMRNNHPSEKYYKCKICPLTFYNIESFRRHEKIHQDNPITFLCSFCAKKFLRADALKRHSRIHTNERPYNCNVCSKTFKQSSELKEHQLIHQSDRLQYFCQICNKVFRSRYGLYVHMKMHSNVRNYKCHFCTKKFVTEGLKSHCKCQIDKL